MDSGEWFVMMLVGMTAVVTVAAAAALIYVMANEGVLVWFVLFMAASYGIGRFIWEKV